MSARVKIDRPATCPNCVAFSRLRKAESRPLSCLMRAHILVDVATTFPRVPDRHAAVPGRARSGTLGRRFAVERLGSGDGKGGEQFDVQQPGPSPDRVGGATR